MKFLLALLLLVNFCFAQKITVKNASHEPLASVSVFAANKLIAISDSLGLVQITLQKDSSYLFHALGYKDQLLGAAELQKSPVVVLNEISYRLNEIAIKKNSYKNYKLVNRPRKFNLGAESNFSDLTQYVSKINITDPGFLKTFKLFAYQTIKGPVRRFRFILFNDAGGKPGEAILAQNVGGVLENDRLVFDLAPNTPFLEIGTYYIGYECMPNLEDYYKAKSESDQKLRPYKYSYVMLKGKTIDTPKMYSRRNLGEWKAMRIILPHEGEFIDLAYEIEMDVIN